MVAFLFLYWILSCHVMSDKPHKSNLERAFEFVADFYIYILSGAISRHKQSYRK